MIASVRNSQIKFILSGSTTSANLGILMLLMEKNAFSFEMFPTIYAADSTRYGVVVTCQGKFVPPASVEVPFITPNKPLNENVFYAFNSTVEEKVVDTGGLVGYPSVGDAVGLIQSDSSTSSDITKTFSMKVADRTYFVLGLSTVTQTEFYTPFSGANVLAKAFVATGKRLQVTPSGRTYQTSATFVPAAEKNLVGTEKILRLS